MQPRNINGNVVTRVLELMGLTQHNRIDRYRIFLNPSAGELVVRFEEKWDMSVEDIEFLLETNGLSVDLFWEKHESLYRRT